MSTTQSPSTALSAETLNLVSAIVDLQESAQLLQGRLRARLGIGPSDLAVLLTVVRLQRAGRAAHPSDLRRLHGMTSATATGVIDRLEASGLLHRRLDPEDGRGRILVPTEEADRRVSELLGDVEHDLRGLLGSIVLEHNEGIVMLAREVTGLLDATLTE